MYGVDLYRRVRLACHREGLSRREASRQFGIDRKTVAKILLHSEPPGYRRRQPPKRPKLAPFTDIIDGILEEDRTVHRKQRHTAKRIFERLRDEHGFTGKQTIVKDYVRERHLGLREMFVPLAHPPGHAEADFGEADAIIAGVMHRAHFFVMTLPHSDACFVAAYPAATAEAWLDGHNAAFAFFGGVPQSILYDNDKCLVSRILPDGTRQRTRSFSGLQSHYLFEDRYGRPGKGNDKGNVEGVVGYARRNFMVPRPRFASWDTFNAQLEEQCRNRQGEVVRGHRETIGERLRRDCEALMVLPPAPQLAKYSLLVIDELGFVPLSKTGAELLFEVFSQRYERGATLVTSNLPFDEWTEIFGSERLTGALLDRLTHHVHILEMNGESYRLNQSQKRRKSPKPPA